MVEFSFRLPDIGEGTAEAECVAWHVAVGDRVEEDQPLLDVMTDKATVEVTSPIAGVVRARVGHVGDLLPVGSVVLVFEIPAVGDDNALPDVPPTSPSPALPAPSSQVQPQRSPQISAAPALRRRAAEQGVDLAAVRGSGPNGRVRQADLDAFLAYASSAETRRNDPIKRVPFAPQAGATIRPIVGLRRRIAERLQDTMQRIPHFSYIEEADLTQLEDLRVAVNSKADGRPRMTLLPFLVRALVKTLPAFPHLNARYDDEGGMLHEHEKVHVGIATQTPAGLVVTVIRDAGARNLWETAAEITRLSTAARDGKASAAELSGSTITITSLGAMGGVATTPVINSPEVAIVGINKLVQRPVVRDGRIEVAKMMNLSSSFDHRIVDGWDAALFIQSMKSMLEAPATMFMDS